MSQIDTQTADGTLMVNRAGLVAVLVDGNLLLEDGRGFSLAGREAAWCIVDDAELSDFPVLATRCAEMQARNASQRELSTQVRAELQDAYEQVKRERVEFVRSLL